jgi:hypothetical protein
MAKLVEEARYLRWRGDMLMKKTDVRAGSTFSFTHLAHVVSTLRYASMRTTSSCSSQLCPPGLLRAIARTSAGGAPRGAHST